MTDALAQWFLQKFEDRRKPWQDLRDIESNDHLARLVETLRHAGQMRNDDVTLVRIGSSNRER